uniref:KIB1-4 beta-propeller domain-containing protein n=3 Tax=Triticinae TaxID=1648030 RepID=A0A452XNK8_AEGTS
PFRLRAMGTGDAGGDGAGPGQAAFEEPTQTLMPFAKKLQTHRPQSWSALPSDLAGLVLRRLPSHADRVRFAAVCHHWCFSRQEHCLPPPLPWLAFPDGTLFGLPHGEGAKESFKLPSSANYCMSGGDWLVFSHNGTCFLMDPFSEVTLTLPNISSFCRVDEPAGIINDRHVMDEYMVGLVLHRDTAIFLRKVIRCSEFLVSAIVDIPPLRTVAYCQPGSTSWLVSGLGSIASFIDMMFYEGMLYIIDRSNNLLGINVGEDNDNGKLRVSRIERLLDGAPCGFKYFRGCLSYFDSYLVESHGALLLVRREIFYIRDNDMIGATKPAVGIEFEVSQSDFQSRSWVKVSSVGDDQALFISKGSSRFVDVSRYKLNGNCIYFLDDGSCDWFWKDAPSSCAVYDMRDGNCFFIPLPTVRSKDVKMLAAWLFPQS